MPGMKAHPGIARLLLATLLSFCTTSALPQAPAFYTVEVVVFRNAGDIGALTGTQAPPPATDDDVEATPVTAGRLSSAASKLRARSGEFRVLAHAAWTQAPTVFSTTRGVSATSVGLGNGISGKLFLKRGDYLHFGADLVIEDGGKRFRINETRQIKPNQIHYFDQPAVGLLAIVTASTG